MPNDQRNPLVVVSPFNVVNFQEGGGHFWVYMQYVLGLREAGCDVYWLECFHSSGDREADAARLAPFFKCMEEFGLQGKTIIYSNAETADGPAHYFGMSRSEAESIFARAHLLLNFHYAISPSLLSRFQRTALVDIDPGLLQFWISRRQLSVPAHDFYFTIGETVGTELARFPDCGLEWVHICPPVSLEQWRYTFDAGASAFTTVSNWDADDWIVDDHETYENTKRVAFLEFADLPALTKQPLELALFLRTQKDAAERQELVERGWRVRLSREVAGTSDAYRAYIRQSRGEFSCAKRSYVKLQTAWISDRTLCYLASGKPAVVQDTGLSRFLPNGEGLFRFSTIDEAAAAFEKINANYQGHCRAARALAENYFDAKKTASKILDWTSVRPQPRTVPTPCSVIG